jgi:hypothetical protein
MLYYFEVTRVGKKLVGQYQSPVELLLNDNDRIRVPVTAEEWTNGFASLPPERLDQAVRDANEEMATTANMGPLLKAILTGLVKCVNLRIPSNKITEAELKAAIKAEL